MSFSLLYVFPEPLPLPKARGVQVAHTLHALAREGVQVTLAFVPPSDGALDPFPYYGLDRPANVALLPISRRLPWPLHTLPSHSNRWFIGRLSRWLKKAKEQNRLPQLIMARHLKASYALLQQFPQLPLLFEAHEIFAENALLSKQSRLRHMEATVLNHAAKVVAISSGAAERLKIRYGVQQDMPIVPSGAALPEPAPEKDWSQINQQIIYAGNLYEWKGAQDLVAAAEWLPGCTITLIGGEPHRIAELTRNIPATGATVQFTGHLPHQQVLENIGRAGIAILPNRPGSVSAFTSPLKLFEYLAAGCAMVVTDLPVFREVLGNDDVRWVPPNHPRALAAGIHELIEHPARAQALGARARQRAQDFTWQARAHRLIRIMEEMAHVA